jgi:hypothetical protein
MPKYMVLGFVVGQDEAHSTEGVLEVVEAANVVAAMNHIQAHYPAVAADLFNEGPTMKSEFVLYDVGDDFPAPANLEWVDQGTLIHKVGLIRFPSVGHEHDEIHVLPAPPPNNGNNGMVGQAGGRRRSRKAKRRGSRKAKRGTRHRKH